MGSANDTRTLAIALDDSAVVGPADNTAASLERVVGALNRLESAAGGMQKPATVSESLRQLALSAGGVGSKGAPGIEKLGSAMDAAAARARKLAEETARTQKSYDAFNKARAAVNDKQGTAFSEKVGSSKLLASGQAWVKNLLGDGAAAKMENVAKELGLAGDKIAPMMPLLKAGGGFLMSGATALAAAAAAVVIATAAISYKLGEFVAKTALAETQFKQGAVNVFDKLGKGPGEMDLKLSLNLAKDLNIDREDAVAKVKSLLQLGFKEEQIPIVVEAVADFAAVKGEAKAEELKSILEKVTAEGHLGSKELKALAGAGISVDELMGKLKKSGESTAQTMARLKGEQVKAAEAIKAITDIVESKVGGVARKSGQSIDGLTNAIKISFLDMFADIDTGPLKELLKNVEALLESDAGKELKAGITEAGNAIFALLKPFEGEEGRAKLAKLFAQAAVAAHEFAEVIGRLNTSGSLDLLLGSLVLITDYLRGMKVIIDAMAKAWEVFDKITGAGQEPATPGIDAGAAQTEALAGGATTGQAFTDGFVGTIKAGASSAVNAAVDLVKAAIGGAATAQDSHSPSRITGKLGAYFTQGYTGSISAANDNAARAGQKFVEAATGGAASATAGAPAPAREGGGQGGAMPNVEINVTVTGGAPGLAPSAEDIGAAVRREMIRFYRDLKKEAA